MKNFGGKLSSGSRLLVRLYSNLIRISFVWNSSGLQNEGGEDEREREERERCLWIDTCTSSTSARAWECEPHCWRKIKFFVFVFFPSFLYNSDAIERASQPARMRMCSEFSQIFWFWFSSLLAPLSLTHSPRIFSTGILLFFTVYKRTKYNSFHFHFPLLRFIHALSLTHSVCVHPARKISGLEEKFEWKSHFKLARISTQWSSHHLSPRCLSSAFVLSS